jgi:DNA-binding GntR family transcriptional regulator
VARSGSPERSKARRSAGDDGRERGRGFGSARVYETLRREILELRIKPDTLLDETEVAARFKLSRSPVREALIRLSAEGLVKTLRNRNSMAAAFDIHSLPGYLDAMELLNRVTSRLAAKTRTAEQLDRIRGLHREHEAA